MSKERSFLSPEEKETRLIQKQLERKNKKLEKKGKPYRLVQVETKPPELVGPKLRNVEELLPVGKGGSVEVARAAFMVNARLPNYMENAENSELRYVFPTGDAHPTLPYDILNPNQWPRYMPEMTNLSPGEVRGRVLQMVKECKEGILYDNLQTWEKIFRGQEGNETKQKISRRVLQAEYGEFLNELALTEEGTLGNGQLDLTLMRNGLIHGMVNWCEYAAYLGRQSERGDVPREQMEDLGSEAQGGLVQAFIQLSEFNHLNEMQCGEAFRYLFDSLRLAGLMERMGVENVDQMINGVYASIRAYQVLRNEYGDEKKCENSCR